jgi:16S rRNA (uracil1498-N3)-methyltransferase
MTAAGPDGRAGPHLFVEDLATPELSDDDAHHLVRVLRTAVGDEVTLSDGRGRWRPGRLADRSGALEAVGPSREVLPPAWSLTVAFAPVKGNRPEWTVQKLTEIGVDRIVPVTADRSVVRWAGERGARQVERLRRVIREASMQSRRCRLPVLDSPTGVSEMLAEPAAVAADPGGPPPTGDERVLIVGPEGGWSDEELDRARGLVGLGPNVLRAETAAVVGAALLVGLREGVTRPTTNSG